MVALAAPLLLGSCAASAPAVVRASPPPMAVRQAEGPVTYQTFYDELSPYGQWINDPEYGYTWVPNAEAGFQPYRTRGHWAYTDYGWTWVSDYAWGWAAFHYGRWRYSDFSGWVWVPGYTWGPAWVAWRQSQGYYGWAPLGPPARPPGGLRVDIGVAFSFGDAPVEPARWCFVPAAYVASPLIATYYVPPTQTTVVYNNTTVIRNTYVNNSTVNNTSINNTTVTNDGRRGGFPAGPARADVERASGQPVQSLRLATRAMPGVASVRDNTLAVYRPPVAAPNDPAARPGTSTAPAPRRVVPLEAVRAPRQNRAEAAAPMEDRRAEAAPHREQPAPADKATAPASAVEAGRPRPAPGSRPALEVAPAAGENMNERPAADTRPRRGQPGLDAGQSAAPVAPVATPPAARRDQRNEPDSGEPRPAQSPGPMPSTRPQSRPASRQPRSSGESRPARPPREKSGRRR